MLIIDSKDCENIDKALKKYKKKFEDAIKVVNIVTSLHIFVYVHAF